MTYRASQVGAEKIGCLDAFFNHSLASDGLDVLDLNDRSESEFESGAFSLWRVAP
jgi:hypothetical protein